MSVHYHIIYVPGLNDTSLLSKHLIRFLPTLWKNSGFRVYPVFPHWEEGISFAPKLKMITGIIDRLANKRNRVFLVGQSAGGAAALNAYCLRKNKVSAVVNATGRLKAGKNVWPSLALAARNSPAFAESVRLFENKNEKTLTKSDRKKIMTMRPFWDEIVPASTVAVKGAINIVIPVPEHCLGGIACCTIYAKKIFNFLANC